ncbi:transposase [Paenibacillus sp. N3.4]|uniref:transposase n=1 Tax=Paenibacillus sp. N3.4 TaxID=2603222 RepID=UPI0011CC2C94|nr:transposase [Paenibacillus sp. N3.4]TXK83626.1 transposase [Paenibacillus sp. N3.4]
MDPYRAFIENILLEDMKAPIKQRHTSARIFERLSDEYGFTGGESTVRHYVRKLRVPLPECFLKLEANPGEQMQVDFGHAEVSIDGQRVKICLSNIALSRLSSPFQPNG